jgi:acetyl-CoA carboxylase biotin carboxyl carrier protein
MKSNEKELTYDLTYKDVVDILKIIDESTCQELHLELGDLKLDIVKGTQAGDSAPGIGAPRKDTAAPIVPVEQKTPVKPQADKGVAVSQPTSTPNQTPAPQDVAGIPIKTSLGGIFYRAPSPGAKPFVDVGSVVKAGDQVAIVEVMKLMNSVSAPQDGIIREIFAENETKVNIGQILMAMDPLAKGGKKPSKKSK